MRWKRTVLLGAASAGLFAAVLGNGGLTMTQASKLGKNAVISLLAAPLVLLDERSPGGRGQGMLRSTKSGPHERVLPTLRDRIFPLIGSPVVNIDIPPGTFAPIPDALPEEPILPENLTLGSLVSQPFMDFPGGLIGGAPLLPQTIGPESPPQGPSQSSPDNPTGTSPTAPSGNPSSPQGPGSPSSPQGPGSPSSPTGPGNPSSPTGPVMIPEPGSWSVLFFGLLAIGFAFRRTRL